MYCPNCGVKNDDGDLFCASCGTPLREVEVPVEPEFQGYETSGAQPEGAAQQLHAHAGPDGCDIVHI